MRKLWLVVAFFALSAQVVLKNNGTTVGPVNSINCGTGMTCTRSGSTGTFVSSGDGGLSDAGTISILGQVDGGTGAGIVACTAGQFATSDGGAMWCTTPGSMSSLDGGGSHLAVANGSATVTFAPPACPWGSFLTSIDGVNLSCQPLLAVGSYCRAFAQEGTAGDSFSCIGNQSNGVGPSNSISFLSGAPSPGYGYTWDDSAQELFAYCRVNTGAASFCYLSGGNQTSYTVAMEPVYSARVLFAVDGGTWGNHVWRHGFWTGDTNVSCSTMNSGSGSGYGGCWIEIHPGHTGARLCAQRRTSHDAGCVDADAGPNDGEAWDLTVAVMDAGCVATIAGPVQDGGHTNPHTWEIYGDRCVDGAACLGHDNFIPEAGEGLGNEMQALTCSGHASVSTHPASWLRVSQARLQWRQPR